MDIDKGASKKQGFKRSSTLLIGLPDSTTLTKMVKSDGKKHDEDDKSSDDDDERKPMNTEMRKSTKHNSMRASRTSKRSKSILMSETLEVISMAQKFPKLTRFRNSLCYLITYYFCYYFLALNDHLRLLLLSKDQDIIFLVFTIIFTLVFVQDIITRSIVEAGYFLRFFFLVDCFSLIIIFASVIVNDVGLYITLSFLKTIMIVRVTQIVVSYRKYARTKLVEKGIRYYFSKVMNFSI